MDTEACVPTVERQDEPGAWQHVMNRAVGNRDFFVEPDETRFFLSLVARAVRRGWIEVHAFAVLKTHFHLLVRSVQGRIGATMAWIQSRYVTRFNLSHERDGPLVKGRFTSKRADELTYRFLLVGYIDWNPVAAGMAAHPFEFEDGSASRFAAARRPRWLSTEWIDTLVGRPDPRVGLDRQAYEQAFQPSPGQAELVERRLRAPSNGTDPGELLGAPAPRISAWLRERARLADGDPKRSVVLVGAHLLLSMIREAGGDVLPPPHHPRADVRQSLAAGLLRQLAGLTFKEIGARLSLSSMRAHALARRHGERLAADDTYADACANLTAHALRATYCLRIDRVET